MSISQSHLNWGVFKLLRHISHEINHLQVPFVFVNPAMMLGPFSGGRIGNPTFPSFEDNPILSLPKTRNFWHRTIAAVASTALWGFVSYTEYRSVLGRTHHNCNEFYSEYRPQFCSVLHMIQFLKESEEHQREVWTVNSFVLLASDIERMILQ